MQKQNHENDPYCDKAVQTMMKTEATEVNLEEKRTITNETIVNSHIQAALSCIMDIQSTRG